LLLLEWSYRAKTAGAPPEDEYVRRFANHIDEVSSAWSAGRRMIPAETRLSRRRQDVSAVGSILLAAAGLAGYEQVKPIGEGGMGEVSAPWTRG